MLQFALVEQVRIVDIAGDRQTTAFLQVPGGLFLPLTSKAARSSASTASASSDVELDLVVRDV